MRQRSALRFIAVAGLTAAALSLSSCEKHAQNHVLVLGSTSVQPFAEKLSLAYHDLAPGVRIDVQGGGSTQGIHVVHEGATDIGTSSRELSAAEREGLRVFTIAGDGIAVIVETDNPIDNLSLDQIRKIFTGEYGDWSQVGGRPGPIYAVTREEGSGTRGAFQEMVMKESDIAPECLVANSNGAVREMIGQSASFIGFISLGLVDRSVKAVKIDGIAPSHDSIADARYPLVRPFLFLTQGEPQGPVKAFIDYALGPAGQKLLENEGLVGGALLTRPEKDHRE